MKPIAAYGIGYRHDASIPDIITRIRREQTNGNVIILVSGKAQTGKSNAGLWLAHKLTNKPIITFKFIDFFKVAIDKKLKEQIIFYDEVQQDLSSWYSLTYQICKQILESYGFKHHILIIVTPRVENLYGILDLVHVLIKMKKRWFKREPKYVGHFYLLEDLVTGKIIPLEFQQKNIDKMEEKIWNKYMKLKKENYEDRSADWLGVLDGSKMAQHNHEWRYVRREGIHYCRKCGIESKKITVTPPIATPPN